MMDIVEGYVLTDIELMCMASLMDIDSIYGYKIKESSEKEMAKKLKYALYNLAKKNCIQICNDKIEIVSELKDMLTIISDADEILDIKNKETKESIIVYRERAKVNAVVIRSSVTKSDELLACKIGDSDIDSYLEDEVYGKYTLDEIVCEHIEAK